MMPSAWAPATRWEDPDKALGGWLWLGLPEAVVAFWGVSQWIEDSLIPPSLSPLLPYPFL